VLILGRAAGGGALARSRRAPLAFSHSSGVLGKSDFLNKPFLFQFFFSGSATATTGVLGLEPRNGGKWRFLRAWRVPNGAILHFVPILARFSDKKNSG